MEMVFNIKNFALRRALLSAVAAGAVNFAIVYFVLSDEQDVPIFALVADIWNHSLIGALIPRSIVISFIITMTTVLATAKEATHNHKDIEIKLSKTHWLKIAIRKALVRALIALSLVVLLAVILRVIYPTFSTMPVSYVIFIVGIFAALVAFSMTYSAVLSTGKTLESQD